jgi:hypothetical protein
LDIELHFKKIYENQVNLPKFYQIRNQKKRVHSVRSDDGSLIIQIAQQSRGSDARLT